MLDHRRGRFALAAYELDVPAICKLDDARMLVSLDLRPSRVVTRQRRVTQRWSADIFGAGGADGISWWSYYDADWTSIGLWNVAKLRHTGTRPLTITDPEIVDAASTIMRRIG